jgi:hypothetical protein
MLKRVRKIVFSHTVDVWTMHICRRIHSLTCWRPCVAVIFNISLDEKTRMPQCQWQVLRYWDRGSEHFTYKRDKASKYVGIENRALPGYYVACCGNYLLTFRDNLSVQNSRVDKSNIFGHLISIQKCLTGSEIVSFWRNSLVHGILPSATHWFSKRVPRHLK